MPVRWSPAACWVRAGRIAGAAVLVVAASSCADPGVRSAVGTTGPSATPRSEPSGERRLQASLLRDRFHLVFEEDHETPSGEPRDLAFNLDYDVLETDIGALALAGSYHEKRRSSRRQPGRPAVEPKMRQRHANAKASLDLFAHRLRIENEVARASALTGPDGGDVQPGLAVVERDHEEGGAFRQHVQLHAWQSGSADLDLWTTYAYAEPGYRSDRDGLESDRETLSAGGALGLGIWSAEVDSRTRLTNVAGRPDVRTEQQTRQRIVLAADLGDDGGEGLARLVPRQVSVVGERRRSADLGRGHRPELSVRDLAGSPDGALNVRDELALRSIWRGELGRGGLRFRHIETTGSDHDRGRRHTEVLGLQYATTSGRLDFESRLQTRLEHGGGEGRAFRWATALGYDLEIIPALDAQLRLRERFEAESGQGAGHRIELEATAELFEDVFEPSRLGEAEARSLLEATVGLDLAAGRPERATAARAMITGGWRF